MTTESDDKSTATPAPDNSPRSLPDRTQQPSDDPDIWDRQTAELADRALKEWEHRDKSIPPLSPEEIGRRMGEAQNRKREAGDDEVAEPRRYGPTQEVDPALVGKIITFTPPDPPPKETETTREARYKRRARAERAALEATLPEAKPQVSREPAGYRAALAELGIDYRLNVRGPFEEYRQTPDPKWKRVTRRTESAIAVTMREKFDCMGDDPFPYQVSAEWRTHNVNSLIEHNKVDPFREWLDTIPEWDGKERLDTWITDLWTDWPEAEPVLLEWASRYPFVAAILRAVKPGAMLREFPIVIGPENCGKSTALKYLFPRKHQREWYAETLDLAQNDRRNIETMQGRVLVELGEMSGITRKDLQPLKAFLTQTNDGLHRMSYARTAEPMDRRCVFFGTANPRPSVGVLPYDPEGNTRFVALETTSDKATQKVETFMNAKRDQLWAEALVQYERGSRPNLPREFRAMQKAANEPHLSRLQSVEDLVWQYVDKYPNVATNGIEIAKLTAWCRSPLNDGGGGISSVNDKAAAEALTALGWKSALRRVKGQPKRRWYNEGVTPVTPVTPNSLGVPNWTNSHGDDDGIPF